MAYSIFLKIKIKGWTLIYLKNNEKKYKMANYFWKKVGKKTSFFFKDNKLKEFFLFSLFPNSEYQEILLV